MKGRTIRLESEDRRWIELTVSGARGMAKVGDTEPFPFNYEHLLFVASGLGYQAWGGGSHFAFRPDGARVTLEFQGSHDRSASICHLSLEHLESLLEELQGVRQPSYAATLI